MAKDLHMDDTYTFSDYIEAFNRRRRIFLLILVPIVAIAAGIALTLPDVYRSTSRIAVDLEGSNVRTLEPIQVAAYADQYVAELRDRVLAYDNLLPFAERDSAFPPEMQQLSADERVAEIQGGFFFQLELQPVMTENGREVDIMSGFRAGHESSNPEFAFSAAKFIAESFLTQDRRLRTERASSTSNFLEKQLAETEARIVQYESEVAKFKVENACCLPELRELNLTIIQRAERDIEDLQPRIRTLEQDREFLKTQLNEIRQQTVSTDRLAELEQEYVRLVANYGPDHPDVARVRREIAAITNIGPLVDGSNELTMLRVELAQAQRKYSDLHPDVVSLKRRIEALEEQQPEGSRSGSGKDGLNENPRYLQLRAEMNALDTELAELRRRAPELRSKIEEYEKRLTRTPQIESEYQALNRKLESARETYDDLQRRGVVAQQTEALESTDIGARISEVRGARLPTSPSGPPRLGILIIGIIFSGTVGLGSVIMAEMLDSTIRGSKDIIRAIEMVPISNIPVIHNSVSKAALRRQWIFITSLSLITLAAVAVFIVANLG